jgi:hypothetical protein
LDMKGRNVDDEGVSGNRWTLDMEEWLEMNK